ncbi:uncharacterized protein DS421_7g219100 [Arachis hypogaea]|nr:uncharacterized protein DS421_7g219100 [Arachis hypogaea]
MRHQPLHNRTGNLDPSIHPLQDAGDDNLSHHARKTTKPSAATPLRWRQRYPPREPFQVVHRCAAHHTSAQPQPTPSPLSKMRRTGSSPSIVVSSDDCVFFGGVFFGCVCVLCGYGGVFFVLDLR